MPINPTVEEISLREVLLPAVIKILLDGQGSSCHHLPPKHHSLSVSLAPFVLLSLSIVFFSSITMHFGGLITVCLRT